MQGLVHFINVWISLYSLRFAQAGYPKSGIKEANGENVSNS